MIEEFSGAKRRLSVKLFESTDDVLPAHINATLVQFERTAFGEEIPNVDPHFPVQIVAIAVLEIPHLSLVIQSLDAL